MPLGLFINLTRRERERKQRMKNILIFFILFYFFQRRKFLYGRLPCDYSPFPDVASAKKVMSWKKLADGGHLMPSNVDSCRREELRNFHEVREREREKESICIGK
jgi:hypothetical protein